MGNLNIVIPFKHPESAKERLGDVLSPAQRTELALLLFHEVLRFLRTWSPDNPILVVSDSDQVERLVAPYSVSVLREKEARGETAAVEAATEWSVARGFASQLVMPADMACLDPADMTVLLEHSRPNPSVLLCPATGDDGTNAILTTPPDVIPFRFGKASFPGYRERAARRGVPCAIVRLRSFVLDLDTPADLRAFASCGEGHPALARLREWNITCPS